MFANRIVIILSRFLGIAATCIILLFLQLNIVNHIGMARRGRDGIFSVIFLHFGAFDFPIKSLIQKPSKLYICRLCRRDPVLDLQFLALLCIVILYFAI